MKPFFILKSFLAAPFAAPKRSISCDFSHELQADAKNLRTNCFAELLKHYVGNAFNRSVRKCIDGLRIVAEIVDLKKTSELEVPAYKFSLSCLTYFQQISRAELNVFYNRHVVVIFVGIYRKKVDSRTSGICDIFSLF